jgi:hypothetical protein
MTQRARRGPSRGPRRGGTARDEQQVRQFVEQMSMTLAESGFPRMAARVFVALMTVDAGELTAAELAEQLDVSPAGISGAARYLVHLGLVERVPVPGSRRDVYRLPDDAWYHSSASAGGIYRSLARASSSGVDALGATTPAGRRVAEMRDFFAFIEGEMAELVARWQATRKQ